MFLLVANTVTCAGPVACSITSGCVDAFIASSRVRMLGFNQIISNRQLLIVARCTMQFFPGCARWFVIGRLLFRQVFASGRRTFPGEYQRALLGASACFFGQPTLAGISSASPCPPPCRCQVSLPHRSALWSFGSRPHASQWPASGGVRHQTGWRFCGWACPHVDPGSCSCGFISYAAGSYRGISWSCALTRKLQKAARRKIQGRLLTIAVQIACRWLVRPYHQTQAVRRLRIRSTLSGQLIRLQQTSGAVAAPLLRRHQRWRSVDKEIRFRISLATSHSGPVDLPG